MAKEGDRVLAISHADADVLYVFGQGVYMGDMSPKDFSKENQPVGQLAEIMMEVPEYTNPCIKLDDGKIIWGCECWWGPLDDNGIQRELEAFTETRKVDIHEQRSKYRSEE